MSGFVLGRGMRPLRGARATPGGRVAPGRVLPGMGMVSRLLPVLAGVADRAILALIKLALFAAAVWIGTVSVNHVTLALEQIAGEPVNVASGATR